MKLLSFIIAITMAAMAPVSLLSCAGMTATQTAIIKVTVKGSVGAALLAEKDPVKRTAKAQKILLAAEDVKAVTRPGATGAEIATVLMDRFGKDDPTLTLVASAAGDFYDIWLASNPTKPNTEGISLLAGDIATAAKAFLPKPAAA